jgi:hypothetical protein
MMLFLRYVVEQYGMFQEKPVKFPTVYFSCEDKTYSITFGTTRSQNKKSALANYQMYVERYNKTGILPETAILI